MVIRNAAHYGDWSALMRLSGNVVTIRVISAFACVLGFLCAGSAGAQQKSIKDEIVGAWSLTTVTAQLA